MDFTGNRATDSRFPGQFETPPPTTSSPEPMPPPPGRTSNLSHEEMQRQIQNAIDFGIVPPGAVMYAQELANAQARREYESSSISGLTFETAISDAQEALTGIVADLTGATPRKSIKDMVTYKDRLRGIGILLVALALIGLVIDYFLFPAAASVPAVSTAPATVS